MKLKTTIALLFLSTIAFAQLTVKSGGRVYDAQGEKLAPAKVRELLSTNVPMLDLYDEGKAKKTTGNIFLIAGPTLIAADLAMGLSQDKEYPTALTYVGALALIVAIPIKVGYSKKIRNAINGYNEKKIGGNFKFDDISVCAAPNGMGVRLKF